MVRVDVRYKCGHESNISLVGKKAVIAEQKEVIEAGDCPECQQQQWNDEIAKLTHQADKLGLVPLYFSEFPPSSKSTYQIEILKKRNEEYRLLLQVANRHKLKYPESSPIVDKVMACISKRDQTYSWENTRSNMEVWFLTELRFYKDGINPLRRIQRIQAKTKDFLDHPSKYGMPALKGYADQVKLGVLQREWKWRALLRDIRDRSDVDEQKLYEIQTHPLAQFWISHSAEDLLEIVMRKREFHRSHLAESIHASEEQIVLPEEITSQLPQIDDLGEVTVIAERCRAHLLTQFIGLECAATRKNRFSIWKALDVIATITDPYWFVQQARIPAYVVAKELNRIQKNYRAGMPSMKATESWAGNIIRPSSEKLAIPVVIKVMFNTIRIHASYYVHDLYNILQKRHGMTRDRHTFVRNVNTEISGHALDRAAEIALDLLSRGYVVQCEPKTLYQKVLNRDIEPLQTKWIRVRTRGQYAGELALQWDRSKDDLYKVARRIKGSAWDAPYVIFPRTQFKEIQDFCHRFDVQLNDAAKKVLQEQEKQHHTALRMED